MQRATKCINKAENGNYHGVCVELKRGGDKLQNKTGWNEAWPKLIKHQEARSNFHWRLNFAQRKKAATTQTGSKKKETGVRRLSLSQALHKTIREETQNCISHLMVSKLKAACKTHLKCVLSSIWTNEPGQWVHLYKHLNLYDLKLV